jgi:carbonyl reductase 1
MATPKVIIVTGAVLSPIAITHQERYSLTLRQNRGIGRAICQRILTTEPNISPLKLFATTRSGQDLGLETRHATRSVMYPKLDITDRSSIKDFAKEVSQYGSVDVLINNAGVNLDNEYSAANAKKTMDVNYTAMLDVSTIVILPYKIGLTG